MKREVETKFYTYSQNNSGGRYVTDEKYGVGEYMIIEAMSSSDAWDRLQDIGDNVYGFDSYCSCCGERWSSYSDDPTEEPTIYGKPIDSYQDYSRGSKAYIHYFDRTMKEVTLKYKYEV